MAKLDKNQDKNYEKVALSEKEKNNEKYEVQSYGYGVRHVQAFIIFTCLTITFIARAHLSVTIVAMTDAPKSEVTKITITNNITEMNDTGINITTEVFNTTIKEPNDKEDPKYSKIVCVNGTYKYLTEADYAETQNAADNGNCAELKGLEKVNNTSDILIQRNNDTNGNVHDNTWSVYKIYAWPKSTQEMVLSSFFLGYLVMMSPMGLVAQRWGGKLPLQISLFSSGVVSFVTPWLAVWGGYRAVCATRVITGLMQAGTFPSIHTLIAKWVPLSERGRLATYIYTGSMIGAVLAFHVSGFLAASPLGWPSVFWVTGVLCIIMSLLVTLFVSPTPQQNRFISEEEKRFILGGVKEETKRPSTPWRAILTSKPVWAGFIAHIGTSTSYLFFFTQVPTYLHFIVGLNIKNSGLLSSLPYFANFLTSIGMGILSDYFTNNKIMTLKHVRIISTTIANVGPALCLFTVSFTTNPLLAVTLLVICMGTHAGTHTGWMVNYIDLAPNFSGTLMATGNTLMNVSALLLPVLVSNIVIDVTNVHQWRIIMFVVATLALICNAVFVVFMSADIQPWNACSYESTDQEDPDLKSDDKSKKHLTPN